MSNDRAITVTTLYGRDAAIPLVQIEVPDGKAQLSIEEAEDLARNIVHACEASLTDAFLIEFLRGPVLELEDAQVWGVIRAFREWREARIAKPPAGAGNRPLEAAQDARNQDE